MTTHRHTAVAALIVCASAATATAADIRVASIPGVKAAVDTLVPGFEAQTGHKVVLFYEIYAGQKQRIEAGAFDVAVFGSRQIEEMIGQSRLVPKTVVPVARTSIGVAVRKGAARPDIGSEAAFKQTLLSARSITFTKESATGHHVFGLLQRLGIAEAVLAKTKLQPGGNMTTPAVAEGEAELAIVLVSDIVAHPGVDLVGPLPAGLQNEVTQLAGIGANASEPEAGAALIRHLTTAAAGVVFKAKGLEPPAR